MSSSSSSSSHHHHRRRVVIVPTDDDVEEYSRLIGLREKDKDLMWILAQGLRVPLPEPWRVGRSKTHNNIFYHNKQTGQSTWVHPHHDEFLEKIARERARPAQHRRYASKHATSSITSTNTTTTTNNNNNVSSTIIIQNTSPPQSPTGTTTTTTPGALLSGSPPRSRDSASFSKRRKSVLTIAATRSIATSKEVEPYAAQVENSRNNRRLSISASMPVNMTCDAHPLDSPFMGVDLDALTRNRRFVRAIVWMQQRYRYKRYLYRKALRQSIRLERERLMQDFETKLLMKGRRRLKKPPALRRSMTSPSSSLLLSVE